ncbi:hypothetical protein POM88_028266 [Heracleum sosnowskyi]|uniref:Molybdenum cofactor sulfurase n=1 Tax=Heracleum sosnowskyi TaxID=360622 RepID=A0AAD8IBL4_9APIA|nr:hypothetical protein POM88_028266 [Heracleum sosnowskyi]
MRQPGSFNRLYPCNPCTSYQTDLRKRISNKKKRKKDSATGPFVFPDQSRVTGARHGLSLFRPDFIVTSFYKVFGYDPTGFGCLLIKKSAMGSLQNHSGHAGSGIVKITLVFPLYLSDSIDSLPGLTGVEGDELDGDGEVTSETRAGVNLPAFSGEYTSAQVRDVH